jgi:hypothetical protein
MIPFRSVSHITISHSAGIVWDEEAVYKELGGPPNNWSRQETFFNIIRKIDVNEVDGGPWDPMVRHPVWHRVP